MVTVRCHIFDGVAPLFPSSHLLWLNVGGLGARRMGPKQRFVALGRPIGIVNTANIEFGKPRRALMANIDSADIKSRGVCQLSS